MTPAPDNLSIPELRIWLRLGGRISRQQREAPIEAKRQEYLEYNRGHRMKEIIAAQSERVVPEIQTYREQIRKIA